MNLFSPSDPKLRNLFLNQMKFLKGQYSQEPFLRILTELRFQESPQLDDVINSAKCILSDHTLSSANSRLKSNAVVYWLKMMAAQNVLPPEAIQKLLTIPFLKVLKTLPVDDYPMGLVWAGSLAGTSPFASPKDCLPKSFLNLVGSALLVSETEITSDELQTIFYWKALPLLHIVQHLKNLSHLDCETMDQFEGEKVTKMLDLIYLNLSQQTPNALD